MGRGHRQCDSSCTTYQLLIHNSYTKFEEVNRVHQTSKVRHIFALMRPTAYWIRAPASVETANVEPVSSCAKEKSNE